MSLKPNLQKHWKKAVASIVLAAAFSYAVSNWDEVKQAYQECKSTFSGAFRDGPWAS